MNERSLTTGNPVKVLLAFAVPFFLSNLMQAAYGAVDLFTVGRFTSTSAVSAVNIGSQTLQIVTVFVTGIFMGTTVATGNAAGISDKRAEELAAAASRRILIIAASLLTLIMWLLIKPLTGWMQTPPEAVDETITYLRICILGIPFISIFNENAAILRGLGDSGHPMISVLFACVTNVAGDFLLTGYFDLGVRGVAAATVAAQAVSAFHAWHYVRQTTHHEENFKREEYKSISKKILKIGFPIAMQDTLINISFMIITLVANTRGLAASSAVGIVEKIIIFMFLVPSAMLSSISAFTAQNDAAGKHDRIRTAVRSAMLITALFGAAMCALSWIFPSQMISIFTQDPDVILYGGEYIRSYSIDCILVSVTFVLNRYLCGSGNSLITFIHNTLAIFLVRIPMAFLLSAAFPDTMFPMGFASPLGTTFSIVFLAIWFRVSKARGEKHISA
jgi:putative MATE family efflux protein